MGRTAAARRCRGRSPQCRGAGAVDPAEGAAGEHAVAGRDEREHLATRPWVPGAQGPGRRAESGQVRARPARDRIERAADVQAVPDNGERSRDAVVVPTLKVCPPRQQTAAASVNGGQTKAVGAVHPVELAADVHGVTGDRQRPHGVVGARVPRGQRPRGDVERRKPPSPLATDHVEATADVQPPAVDHQSTDPHRCPATLDSTP